MAIERKVLGRRGQHLVALPARVRAHLRSVPGGTLYWRITRRDEAVLSRKERGARGPARDQVECPACAALQRENAKLRARDVARDRSLYAEGVIAGHNKATQALLAPHGPSAARARRLRLSMLIPPSRSARRKDARARRAQADVIAAPVLDPPPSSTE